MKASFVDLTGKTFEKLFVVRYLGLIKNFQTWECKCSCGEIRNVNKYSLLSGANKSCGCSRSEITAKSHTKHGEGARGAKTQEYMAWLHMKQRCSNTGKGKKIYKNYSGRGITVYEPWINDYPAFLDYMGRKPTSKHSLDRIDVNGNYEPGNVRWATTKEQCNNKRDNVYITREGETKTIAQWCERLGLRRSTINNRIYRCGLTFEDAIKPFVKRPAKMSSVALLFTYNGEEKCLAEWCKVLDLNYGGMYYRVVTMKMDFKDAAETQWRGSKKSKGYTGS